MQYSAAVKTAAAKQSRRTQKARGVEALHAAGYKVPNFTVYGIEYFTEPTAEQVSYKVPASIEADGSIYYEKRTAEQEQFCLPFVRKQPKELVGKFVRPCPTVPRHGFVDSRPVKTLEEAEQIIEQTLAAEPLAELIAMPFIDAKYSAIWTPGQLVIGDGNDGATSGHGSRVIPVIGQAVGSEVYGPASITDSPYVELLWTENYSSYNTHYVQLRNGPAVPAVLDSHKAAEPGDDMGQAVTVSNIATAEGDLLEWETKAATFPKGTAVYHPGGSLASHYAVHAVLHGHPVLTTRKPVLGEKLVPNTKQAEPDVNAVRAGFVYGATAANLTHTQAVYAMLSACHNTAVWRGRADALLGFGLGAAYRLTITAALGEYRHKPGSSRKASRSAVYEKVWHKMLAASTRTRYVKALDSFKNDKRWPSSYGGAKWYEATVHAGAILNALIDGDVTEALGTLNKLVNAAHNGGWLFDKFCTKDIMDATAANPCKTLLKAAPVFYNAVLTIEKEEDSLAKWFFHRRHYELEEQDSKAAKLDEQEEIAEESEPGDESCECGECGCSSCFPDGCQSESCPNCFPEESYGPVIKAHCKLVKNEQGHISHLHVQYKRQQQAGGKGYNSKTVVADSTFLPAIAAAFQAAEQAGTLEPSWNNGSSKVYLPLVKFAGGWAIQGAISGSAVYFVHF